MLPTIKTVIADTVIKTLSSMDPISNLLTIEATIAAKTPQGGIGLVDKLAKWYPMKMQTVSIHTFPTGILGEHACACNKQFLFVGGER